jgi:hypothetical protein
MVFSTLLELLDCKLCVVQFTISVDCPTSSTECFGLHIGDPQSANLGDGNGWVNQTIELRQDYGDSNTGTCLESLIGGNHFRLVPP